MWAFFPPSAFYKMWKIITDESIYRIENFKPKENQQNYSQIAQEMEITEKGEHNEIRAELGLGNCI